jgi:hypothetical protein
MVWTPEFESTLTLRRIYNENNDRFNKFKEEYDHLSMTPYSQGNGPAVVKRLRYLKEMMTRFKERMQKSNLEIIIRHLHK